MGRTKTDEQEPQDEDPASLRTTIGETGLAARQAAYHSGRVLELMTAGTGGYDPIATLTDAVFLMQTRLEAIEAGLAAILTLLQSGQPSTPSGPTPQRPAGSA